MLTDCTNSAARLSYVSLISLSICALTAIFSVWQPQLFITFVTKNSQLFLEHTSQIVLLGCSFFLLLCITIALSPLGRIRLAQEGESPEFSRISWWSMLFAAGMGAGLVFWGVAEPLMFLASPPPAPDILAQEGTIHTALLFTYLHWALHPWAVYAIGSLSIAYFAFCRGYPMLPSSPFRAMLPHCMPVRVFASLVDILAIIAVVFGIAASLTQGIFQIDSGVARLLNIAPSQTLIMSGIITLIAIVYTLSAATELKRGIKFLSLLNMAVAIGLMLFLLAYGPTLFILRLLPDTIVAYATHLPFLSTQLLDGLSAGGRPWSHVWTITYFLSWIAWVPFVGIFVARISRGRSIREFLLAVLLVPSLFTFVWFAVFGGAALFSDIYQGTTLATIAAADVSEVLFALFSHFPLTQLFWLIITFLVFIFLVTSADSASYVLGMLSSNGSPDPTVRKKLFWGAVLAVLTLGTLFSGDSIHSVRAIFSFGAIPFFFIMILQSALLVIALLEHSKIQHSKINY